MIELLTTEEIEQELNRLGNAGLFGSRMVALEAELRERCGVLDRARDVVSGRSSDD